MSRWKESWLVIGAVAVLILIAGICANRKKKNPQCGWCGFSCEPGSTANGGSTGGVKTLPDTNPGIDTIFQTK